MRRRAWIGIAALIVVAGLIGCQTNWNVPVGGGWFTEPGPTGPGSVVSSQAGDARGLAKRSLRAGGQDRDYYLYVPPSVAGRPAPLVVAFHGGGQSVERFATGVGLRQMADRFGFVVALPEGVQESWNTGSPIPQGYAEEAGIDDLSFVSALVDEVLAQGLADPAHVYAMGVSRGGMMSYYAACNLPGRFAAIAVVAGTLASGSCPDAAGVSLLHIHGTDDNRVPFKGGTGDFTARGQSWASARDGIRTFAQSAFCGADFTTEQVSSDTTCHRSLCAGADEVEYCLVQGGGHTWPGVAATARQQRQGARASSDFDATSYIAQFFLQH